MRAPDQPDNPPSWLCPDDAWRRWVWLVPAVAHSCASRLDGPAESPLIFVSVVVCFGAGALWQLLARRDLVDRFTLLASITLVSLAVWGLFAIADTGYVEWGLSSAATTAMVSGVVLAEQWLRGRQLRALAV